jgi:hypothetical protein
VPALRCHCHPKTTIGRTSHQHRSELGPFMTIHKTMESSPTSASEMPSEMPSGHQLASEEQHLETVFVSSSHEHGTDLLQQVMKSPQIEYPQSVVDPKQQDQWSDRAR